MISAKRLVARLRNFLLRDRAEQELAREVSSHLTLLQDDFVNRGMPPEAARLAAKRAFGGVEQSKHQQREERSFIALEQIRQDLWFSIRTLVKQPVFALAAVLSLGLGLGVNIAVFTLLNALIFRPLPVRHPQQLVHVGSLENNGMIMPLPGPMLSDLRKERGLRGVCGFTAGDAIIEVHHVPSASATLSLTGDCYRTLGVRPAIGRLLTPADDIPNGPKVAVISYALWKEKWDGNPAVLGDTIRISGKPFQIVGVTEEKFLGLLWGYPPSVSAPISQRTVPNQKDPSGHFYWADTLVRLDPGTTPAQLKAALQVKWRRLLDSGLPSTFAGSNRDELLSMPPVVTSATTGVDYYFRDHFGPSLMILLTVSVLLLVVSCFNVANLLFARGSARQREMSIRLAIGAARRRLVQQLLIETALLILGGLAAAVGLSLLTIHFVVQTFEDSYGRADLVMNVAIDGRVLFFVAAAAILVLLLSGVAPAWQTSDVGTAGALQCTGRSLTGGFARSRRFFMIGQLAMTLIVLINANLFAKSLSYLQAHALPVPGDKILNAQLMPLPGGDLDGDAAIQYLQNLLQQMRSIPGVEAASFASFAPLVSSPYKEDIRRLDHPDRVPLQAPAEFVTRDFLRIVNVPLLQGRAFQDSNTLHTPRVAILSKTVARRLFPTENPLGRHIQFGTEPETRDVQVVGVAGDSPLEDPHTRQQGFVLLSLWQLPRTANWGNLQVEFSGPAASVGKALRDAIRRSGHQEVFSLRTLSDLRDMALLQERLLADVGRIYGILALILAAVGLFGLLTYLVSTREKELALRMALGAMRSDIGLLVLREALSLVAIGTAIGLPLSLAASGIAATALYGFSSVSLNPILGSVGILTAVVLAAALKPVWRAGFLDPNLSLRQE